MQCDNKRNYLKPLILVLLVTIFPLRSWADNSPTFWNTFTPPEFHGLLETRAGCRLQSDSYEKDASVMEFRLQGELFTQNDWAEFKFKGDAWYDGIIERPQTDTREAWVFVRPSETLDIKLGRQILTWGTGDLVFLNDLFPKDWQSYFIGRNKEYLKAPSDALKLSYFSNFANIDVVYTPKFDSDRFITGEYVSYWNGSLGRISGNDVTNSFSQPDEWFTDDEVAVRLYKNVNNYEYALYGYWGFWKRPGGETISGTSIFPKLSVYGASARGKVGQGIGNAEIAYYMSEDDRSGSNPLINNSEMRFVLGYTQDLAKDLNASLQYYIEHMLKYSEYRDNLSGGVIRDRDRHVITLQLTQLLMNQNLELSLSSYYSPSDKDAYLRPTIQYKYTDKVVIEGGANIFFGEKKHTFFGQFEKNTNIFAAIRYSFF
jgi:hypothetical protein